VSPITFGILRARGATALAVSDEEVAEAIRWAWREHQLVVEPGGAVALAALLAGKASRARRRWWCVGREYRSGASRADRRRSGLGDAVLYSPGSTWGLDARPPGQLLELGGERLELGGERLGVELGDRLAEASSSVSSIIAMHGRIVSSIRSNASSRRACCCWTSAWRNHVAQCKKP
jgi:hypothetical protein